MASVDFLWMSPKSISAFKKKFLPRHLLKIVNNKEISCYTVPLAKQKTKKHAHTKADIEHGSLY